MKDNHKGEGIQNQELADGGLKPAHYNDRLVRSNMSLLNHLDDVCSTGKPRMARVNVVVYSYQSAATSSGRDYGVVDLPRFICCLLFVMK